MNAGKLVQEEVPYAEETENLVDTQFMRIYISAVGLWFWGP